MRRRWGWRFESEGCVEEPVQRVVLGFELRKVRRRRSHRGRVLEGGKRRLPHSMDGSAGSTLLPTRS